jgi:hypothetical protein
LVTSAVTIYNQGEKMFSMKEVERIIKDAFNEGHNYAYYEQVIGTNNERKEKTIKGIIQRLTH